MSSKNEPSFTDSTLPSLRFRRPFVGFQSSTKSFDFPLNRECSIIRNSMAHLPLPSVNRSGDCEKSALVTPPSAAAPFKSHNWDTLIKARIAALRAEKERSGYSADEDFVRTLKKSLPRFSIQKRTSGDRLAMLRQMSEFIKCGLQKGRPSCDHC